MIRHVFLWNAGEGADADQIVSLLNQLRDRVDCIRSWSVGPHRGGGIGGVDGRYQYGLVCDFDSLADLRAYFAHPFHAELEVAIAPLLGDVAVVDLEI
jgi:hypothetical protein